MTTVRPTRRGIGLALLALALVAVGTTVNRSQAVVLLVPLAVTGGIAYWELRRRAPPSVARGDIVNGRAGTKAPVDLDVRGSERLVGTITDTIAGGGINTDGEYPRRLNGPGTYTYTLTYERRGRYEVGPIEVSLTDSLGLFRRSEGIGTTTSVYVYPRLVRLPGRLKRALDTGHGDADPLGRTEFDRLREYDQSASLRDIDWKTSAKQPDETFIVKEFVGAQRYGVDGVTIAALPATAAGEEGVARAAASIAAYLLDQDVAVGLQTPTTQLSPEEGPTQRRRINEELATLTSARGADADTADVVVTAPDAETVSIAVFDETHTLRTTAPANRVSQV